MTSKRCSSLVLERQEQEPIIPSVTGHSLACVISRHVSIAGSAERTARLTQSNGPLNDPSGSNVAAFSTTNADHRARHKLRYTDTKLVTVIRAWWKFLVL
jgi:hypothetical protein